MTRDHLTKREREADLPEPTPEEWMEGFENELFVYASAAVWKDNALGGGARMKLLRMVADYLNARIDEVTEARADVASAAAERDKLRAEVDDLTAKVARMVVRAGGRGDAS